MLASAVCSSCMLVFPVPDTGAGCRGEAAQYYPAAEVVRLEAADELDCEPSAMRVSAQNDTTFQVSGCGHSLTYLCEADAVSGCSLEEATTRESCHRSEDD